MKSGLHPPQVDEHGENRPCSRRTADFPEFIGCAAVKLSKNVGANARAPEAGRSKRREKRLWSEVSDETWVVYGSRSGCKALR